MRCLLFSKPNNVTRFVTSQFYIQILNPQLENIVRLQTINPKINILSTTVKNKNRGGYIFYYDRPDEGTIQLISNVSSSLIQNSTYNVYNKAVLKQKLDDEIGRQFVTDLKNQVKNNSKMSMEVISDVSRKYRYSISSSLKDLLQKYDKDTLRKMIQIESMTEPTISYDQYGGKSNDFKFVYNDFVKTVIKKIVNNER